MHVRWWTVSVNRNVLRIVKRVIVRAKYGWEKRLEKRLTVGQDRYWQSAGYCMKKGVYI
jgi:hypothetical protein